MPNWQKSIQNLREAAPTLFLIGSVGAVTGLTSIKAGFDTQSG
jgi:hypothetical protein